MNIWLQFSGNFGGVGEGSCEGVTDFLQICHPYAVNLCKNVLGCSDRHKLLLTVSDFWLNKSVRFSVEHHVLSGSSSCDPLPLPVCPVIYLFYPSTVTWRSYSFPQCPSDCCSSHPIPPISALPFVKSGLSLRRQGLWGAAVSSQS